MGFEDKTTFMVVDRDFAGTPISKKSDGTLSTATYDVAVTAGADGAGPSIVVTSPSGSVLFNSSDAGANGGSGQCKGLSQQKCEQVAGVGTCFWDKDDKECESLDKTRPNLLHWPSPMEKKAYALVDSPRFFVP